MRIIYSILLLTFISGHLFAQRSETVQTNDSTFSVIKQLKEVVITAEHRSMFVELERYPGLHPLVCTWMEFQFLTKMPLYLICMTLGK